MKEAHKETRRGRLEAEWSFLVVFSSVKGKQEVEIWLNSTKKSNLSFKVRFLLNKTPEFANLARSTNLNDVLEIATIEA